jgi:CHAT domain
MPPVVALAACYTGAPAGEQAASFAAELVAAGAPAVIGTETSVTDRYATRVFARVYEELAHSPEPDVVAAVGHARRVVQAELAGSGDPRDLAVAGLDEWAVVTVLAGQAPSHLLDPAPPSPARVAAADPSRRTVAGLLARDPGEFVGRRSEQRTLPAVLTGRPVDGVTHHGVLLHGIGGVGKTTLAAEVIRRVQDEDPAGVGAAAPGRPGGRRDRTGVAGGRRAPAGPGVPRRAARPGAGPVPRHHRPAAGPLWALRTQSLLRVSSNVRRDAR